MHTFENPHRGGEVVDAAGGFQRGDTDRGCRDEIEAEGVIQVSLLIRWNAYVSISRKLPI